MDGFQVHADGSRPRQVGDIFCTATGDKHVLRGEHFEVMKDGAILANTGHFNVEIDIPALEAMTARRASADARRTSSSSRCSDGRRDLPAGRGPPDQPGRRRGPPGRRDGHELRQPGARGRVRAASTAASLEKQVYAVPHEIDSEIARLKLETMGVDIDVLTRRAGRTTWPAGTRAPEVSGSPGASPLAGARTPRCHPARAGTRWCCSTRRCCRASAWTCAADRARALVDAIQELAIRGAPAIGIAAAMGMALAARTPAPTTRPRCAAARRARAARWPARARRPSTSAWALGACARRSLDGRPTPRRAARRARGARASASTTTRSRAAARWARHGAELLPRGRPRAHALQRRRARHAAATARRSACPAPRTSATRAARLGRRDAAAAAGRAADGLGAAPRTASRTRSSPTRRRAAVRARAASTPSSSAPTASRATATPPTRSAPTRCPCSRGPTACPSTSSRRPRRSTTPSPPARRSRSRSAPRRGRGSAGRARRPRPRRLQPGLRRHAGGEHHRDRHRARRAPRAVRARACPSRSLTPGALPARPARTRDRPRASLAHASLTSLVRFVLPASLRLLPRAGGVDVRALRPRRGRSPPPFCARCGAPTALALPPAAPAPGYAGSPTARSAVWLEGPALALVGRWKRGEISPGRLAAALVAHELPRPQADAIAVVPAVATACWCAGPIRRRSSRPSSPRWWISRSCRSCGARTASVRSAGSTPRARRRNVRGAFAAALDHARRHSSTTSTRRERPSTSARGPCARRARSRCMSCHARTHALDRSFARAPPRGRLQEPTYPSGEARDATSGERQEPGCHGADPRVRRAQARPIERHLDGGHARRSRARDRAQPLDQRESARRADRLDAGARPARPRVRRGHVRGDRPRGRQAGPPGAALSRATPPLAPASPGARHRGAAAPVRRRRGRGAGDRQRHARPTCRSRRSSRRSAST